MGIISNFGEMLPGQVGFGVDFRILFSSPVNELQQVLGESCVGLRQQVGKTGL